MIPGSIKKIDSSVFSDMCITYLQHILIYHEILKLIPNHVVLKISPDRLRCALTQYISIYTKFLFKSFGSYLLYFNTIPAKCCLHVRRPYLNDTWGVSHFSHILSKHGVPVHTFIRGIVHVDNLFFNDKIHRRYHQDIVNTNTCIRHKTNLTTVRQNLQFYFIVPLNYKLHGDGFNSRHMYVCY